MVWPVVLQDWFGKRPLPTHDVPWTVGAARWVRPLSFTATAPGLALAHEDARDVAQGTLQSSSRYNVTPVSTTS